MDTSRSQIVDYIKINHLIFSDLHSGKVDKKVDYDLLEPIFLTASSKFSLSDRAAFLICAL